MSNRTLGDWVLDAASFLNEFKEDSVRAESTGRETNSRAALAAELARDASRFVGEDDISPTIINLDSVMNSLSNYHEWRRSETCRKREILGHMFYAMMGADPKILPKTEDEFAHSSLIIDALNHYGTDDPAKPIHDKFWPLPSTFRWLKSEVGEAKIDAVVEHFVSYHRICGTLSRNWQVAFYRGCITSIDAVMSRKQKQETK